jgi:hypothetical protein
MDLQKHTNETRAPRTAELSACKSLLRAENYRGAVVFRGCRLTDPRLGEEGPQIDPSLGMKICFRAAGCKNAEPFHPATGLKGKYEISLYWTADNMMRTGALLPPGDGPAPTAATPERDSGPTLIQALQDQLGLRLEARKGPVDFLVVDHAEKIPTEN